MKKILILAILFGLYTAANAQKHAKQRFVRVFNVSGKSICRGFLVSETEGNLIIRRGNDTLDVSRSDIGKIKNGRAAGHYILIGSVAVVVPCTIAAVAIAAAASSVASMAPVALTMPAWVF